MFVVLNAYLYCELTHKSDVCKLLVAEVCWADSHSSNTHLFCLVSYLLIYCAEN